MPRYQTAILLAQLQEQTEQTLQTAISQWQQLDDATLSHSAEPGSWSVAQCLAHLNSYSRYYLPAIADAIKKHPGKPSATFRSGWLGTYFTKLMQPKADGTLAKKMKAPANSRPPLKPAARQELDDFITHQETFLQLLRQIMAVNLNQRIPISISPLIKLKLGDLLLFNVAHIQRHVVQAEKAVKSGNKI